MAQITPGVTPWTDTWAQVNKNSRVSDGLGFIGDEDSPQKAVDRLIAALAAGSPLTQPSGGDGLIAIRNGRSYRIDIGSAAFATFVSGLAALAGANVVPASREDLWAERLGFLIRTPEVDAEAEVWQVAPSPAIVVTSGLVNVDGSRFFNATATITGNVSFGGLTNLSARPRRVRLVASGAACTVLATGADAAIGIGAGIIIPDGRFADFEVTAAPAIGAVVRILGVSE